MKRLLHINRNIIQHNAKHGKKLPVCRVQEGKNSRYGQTVDIHGPSKMVYDPDHPLPCGAKLWIETDAEVTITGESTYPEIRELMKLGLE